jgi:hypothetical protein
MKFRHVFPGAVFLATSLAGCRPSTTPPDVSVGSGPAPSASAPVPAPIPFDPHACVGSQPRVRPEGWRCTESSQCEDSDSCTTNTCDLTSGQCEHLAIPNGTCDQLTTYAKCIGTFCCPREMSLPIAAAPVERPR